MLDSYASCIWPLPPEGASRDVAQAYLAMIDGEKNLPEDVQKFMQGSQWMWLRMRYNSSEMTGPYLINDEEEVIADGDAMQAVVDTWDDETLSHYLCRRAVKHKARRS